MAQKIAGSGLNSHHLELAHKRNPDRIHVLFTEAHDGSDRVTKSKKIIESIVAYFSLDDHKNYYTLYVQSVFANTHMRYDVFVILGVYQAISAQHSNNLSNNLTLISRILMYNISLNHQSERFTVVVWMFYVNTLTNPYLWRKFRLIYCNCYSFLTVFYELESTEHWFFCYKNKECIDYLQNS